MTELRLIVSRALEARASANIKVRQPLPTLRIRTHHALSEELLAVIRDEVNVKQVVVTEGLDFDEVVLDTAITPELKIEGDARDIARAIQDARKKADLTPEKTVNVKVYGPAVYQEALLVWRVHIQKQTNTGTLVYEQGEALSIVIV